MNLKNNEKPQETLLLLPAPKAVPAATQEQTSVEAGEANSGPLEAPTPDRKYGENTGRDPVNGRFTEGNPGKPLGARHMAGKIRYKVDSAGGVTRDGQKVSVGDVIADKLTRKAMDGDLKAISIVLDRVDGKVPLAIEVNPVERQGVREYTPEEQAEFDSLFSRNDKPETESIAEAGNPGGNPGTPESTERSAYE
ncbi:MAG: hypothetical protein AB203_01895 [Parcubacteria bacterium C7867-008]|nr:MAG: hypothetical protein AB203_01895 [Parcubacteria bacterium C7867-008]